MTINHITYNTGNNVKFSASDIDKRILFKMKNFVNDARKNEFSELFDGVKLKLTQEGDMYIASLYYMKFPFLLSYGSRNKTDYLWKLVTDAGKKFLPQVPVMTTTIAIRDRFGNSVSSSFRNLQLDRRFYKMFILVSFDEL